MKPILLAFHLPLVGEVSFPAYFTFLTTGLLLAAWITYREAERLDLDKERILDVNLWMTIWGVIGSRALHVLADGHLQEYVDLCVDPKKVPAIDALVKRCTTSAECGWDYLCDGARNVCYPPRDCFAVFEVWRGGLAYYGGFLFAAGFALWYFRRHKLPPGRVADLAAPAIALGLCFGRMGCYLNGCCYGKETSSWIGVVFPRGSTAWQAQRDAGLIRASEAAHAVHPTQLYESLACLAIFAFLYYVVRPNKRGDGDVVAGLLILYGIARGVIEIWRDDDRGVFLGFISTSQIISIPLIALGVYLLWRNRRALPAAPSAPSTIVPAT